MENSLIILHVSKGEDVDEGADPSHDEHHALGEFVELKPDFNAAEAPDCGNP